MRPITLTFSGLRSYRSTATIDFSHLDLFAVIGDTGAGKSTIIEALSLALYGTYTWTGGKLEELIAEGANTMAIELRFAADGDEWVVSRSRHRNASAPVNKLECVTRAEKVDGNRAVNERIERLLGLSHDQFIRAVVMPQGRFDELLRARRTDRNRILRSIFGLDDLRLAREAAEALRAEWTPVRDRADAQRDLLPSDPEAERAAAEQRLAVAERTAAELAAAAAAADRHDARAERLGRHLGRIADALAGVPAEPGDPVGELTTLAAVADGIARARAATEAELEAARGRLAELDAERLEVLDGFARRDDAAQARAMLATGADALDAALADLATASADIDQLTADPPLTTLPDELTRAAASAQQRAEAAEAARRAAERAVDDGRQAWQRLLQARDDSAAAATAVDEAAGAIGGRRARAGDAHQRLADAGQALTRAKVAHSDAVRANAAAAAASGCGAGDPCPVCARHLPEGFVPPSAGDLDTADQAVRAAEEQVERARVDAQRADLALQRALDDLDRLTRAAAEAATAAGSAADDARTAGVDVDATDHDGALAALVSAAHVAADTATSASAAAAAERDRLTAAQATLQARLDRHAERLDAATTARATARAGVEQQRRLGRSLPVGWRPGGDADGDALRAVAQRIDRGLAILDQLDHARSGVDEAVRAAERQLQDLRHELAVQVNQPAAVVLNRLHAHASRVADVSTALTDAVDADVVDGGGVPQLGPVPAVEGDLHAVLEPVAAVVDAARAVLDRAHTAMDALEDRHRAAGAARDEVLARTGDDSLPALHRAAGQASAELTGARQALEAAQRSVDDAAALDAVRAVARPFVANLDVLATTLRDQNFVGHLVSLREAELLAEATRRLKAITGGRYGFVPDFGVVNIGSGEVRTPDNLSGGERFQAALALALALVEIASRGAGRLDAVFVDEGFGTLDAAALDVALDTLGTVAGGGKMVALISHLRPVAEYVDTVLHVTKDDLLGSRIATLGADERERLLADDIRSGLTA